MVIFDLQIKYRTVYRTSSTKLITIASIKTVSHIVDADWIGIIADHSTIRLILYKK